MGRCYEKNTKSNLKMKIFKRIPLYIKISTNEIEITDLSTGKTISRAAIEKFSTRRVIIANYFKLEAHLKLVLNEFKFKRNAFTSINALVQQTEDVVDGITETELRVLLDSTEIAIGARIIIVVKHTRLLSNEDALEAFNSNAPLD